ncbi:YbhB/YbcL family Raf kinase inhibitor-like protein [Nocardia sp. R6R-6]|uniref:YbhB/YbcL family Raf kinase inhibitor-like protein n=1 Tax=Nocardia sp. R6R-6 TaxID=3459303 RepID=UPI00403E3122
MNRRSRFTLVSDDVADGSKLDTPQLSALLGAGGADISPHLLWWGGPMYTESYVVTMHDRSVGTPTAWGLCHWAMVDIPPGVTELRTDAGHPTGRGLPRPARHMVNDFALRRYVGGVPSPSSGARSYVVTVHAVDVPRLNISDEASSAFLDLMVQRHTIDRTTITVACEHP